LHVKKHLGFSALRKIISERLREIEDGRQQGKVNYPLHDCAMSAFAMMFFQDASLLEFQRRMQESINRNNLNTIFKVESIPKDTQLRDVLDQCPTDKLEKVNADFFYHLIDELKAANMSFILVAKPSSHKILFEWFTDIKRMGDACRLEFTDFKGRHHIYEWVNEIPLNGTKDADDVNFFYYRLVDKEQITFLS